MNRHPLDILADRGFVQNVTDLEGLRGLFDRERVTYYVGFDPSAPSLHIGHLLGMLAMAWLQRAGHRPIALAGGGTGRIGDPSGRDAERELLEDDTLARNLAGIEQQLGRVIDLTDGMLLDNNSWLSAFGFIEFLRDVGKHFSVNQMISRESVRRRLAEREQGISFTEFSYQLLQAYDFAHLYEAHGCRLQLGGSDQWGNITAGIDLTRRLHDATVFGVVWPLIERSDGKKMSSSTGDALWLSAELTSPYAFYQWFVNLPDADVGRFLRLYTFLPPAALDELEAETAANPAARIAQRALAAEITAIVHGPEGVGQAERASRVLFGDDPFDGLDDRTLADAFSAAPSAELPQSKLTQGLSVVDLLTAVEAARSRSEARRLISQGGVRINNRPIDDLEATVEREHVSGTSTIVIRVGKKRYFLVRLS